MRAVETRSGLGLVLALAMALAMALVGCTPTRVVTRTAPTKPAVVTMDEARFDKTTTGEVVLVDPTTILEAANQLYTDGKYAESIAMYQRVLDEFPGSSKATAAIYNQGLALEKVSRIDEALANYQRLPDDLDALYRSGALLIQLLRFDDASAHYEKILARPTLSLSDRVQAYAERGRALLTKKDYEGAERVLRAGVFYYRDHKLEERLESDFFLGQASYHLAQVSHEQFRLMPIRLPDSVMQNDLELKARMLLLAQRRYVDTMAVNHVEWAVAAGFQIGALYREMYDAFLNAPVPSEAKGELREVYVDQLKKKVRPLLEKAVNIFEKNVLMAERAGVRSDWQARSVAQLDELRALLLPGPPAEQRASPPTPVAPQKSTPKEEPTTTRGSL